MKAVNIKWEVDDEDIEAGIDLPSEVDLPAEIAEDPDYKNAKPGTWQYQSLLDSVENYLSDEYGFCHDGFVIEI
ncbi:hypothetical protein bpr_II134 (plasmid) [Butyrivibrio proteoclasticus B316]|uniref:Uncharacterized protein n=1 Tax=Butyrivibrio proteoclasticus (strain ATCC 51982 / DSM 14932 / B316) TaxID=515622 RepID=E0S3U1_BUTPB|nr:hypothetical protein [Butyrivibrio proteoclasticus]ADL36073.1 hypothetical protein bpr_II134 [Butyrivibrio proteoclasticus B316]